MKKLFAFCPEYNAYTDGEGNYYRYAYCIIQESVIEIYTKVTKQLMIRRII